MRSSHEEQAIDSVLNTVVDERAAGGEVKLRNTGSLRTVYPKRTAKTWLPGARGKVHDVVKESRAMRGVHEDLDREREKDAEIERLRSSRSSERVPGGGKGVAGVHKGRATLDVRGVGSAPVEEEETSLFLTDEWMQELQSVGKGDSGATTSHLMGQRTARLHRSTESSLWHRSAADTAAPSLSSRA